MATKKSDGSAFIKGRKEGVDLDLYYGFREHPIDMQAEPDKGSMLSGDQGTKSDKKMRKQADDDTHDG